MLDIDNCIKQSLKTKNEVEVKVYRNLKARILEFKTAKNAKPYTEKEEIKLISKESRKLEAAILEFSKADRQDLVSEYRDELEVLKKLLPAPIKVSEIYIELGNWLSKNNLLETKNPKFNKDGNPIFSCDSMRLDPKIPKKEMGNVIKYLKSKFPTADGKMISNVVKEFIV